MSGLIFLWQNVQNVPPVNIDYGLRPYILIDDYIPPILVSDTDASFDTSTTLVNSTTVTMNDPNFTVGGRDIFSAKPDISARIDDIKPVFYRVGQL